MAALAWASRLMKAPTGIEPVTSSSHDVERKLLDWIENRTAAAVALYRPHFEAASAA